MIMIADTSYTATAATTASGGVSSGVGVSWETAAELACVEVVRVVHTRLLLPCLHLINSTLKDIIFRGTGRGGSSVCVCVCVCV